MSENGRKSERTAERGMRRRRPAIPFRRDERQEKLRRAVEELSEAEAAEALEVLVRRNQRDSLDELLDNAPIDDEPTTPEEDEGVREAKAEIARGEVFSADEIKREIA